MGALAAYTDAECEAWRLRLVAYLKANRDHAARKLSEMGLSYGVPEASYLMGIDSTAALPGGRMLTHALPHVLPRAA